MSLLTNLPPVAGPYLAAVALLGGAGLSKLLRPHDTAVALRSAGLGLRLERAALAVRVAALAEVAVAVGALAVPGAIPAAAVALSYAGFTAYLAAALIRRWPLSSCGCFGRADVLPTLPHVVVDGAGTVAATWWALSAHRSVPRYLLAQPGGGVPMVLGVALCALLAYLVLTNPLAQARLRGLATQAPAGSRGRS